ncbi:MAG TPA: insulinase family protein [Allosphingosinicella sp.]
MRSSPLAQVEIAGETLRSGMRVVYARTPPVPGRPARVFVASYVLAGVFEEERQGWAHLMEHVAANNRAAIANPHPTREGQIVNGNALARPYYTNFLLIGAPDALPAMIHGRMARAGRFADDAAVFANEVGRVVTELRRDRSSLYPAYSALVSAARGRSPRLEDEVASVAAARQETLAEAMAPLYRPERTVLAISGDIDVAAARAMVRDAEARFAWPAAAPVPIRAGAPGFRFGGRALVEGQNTAAQTVAGLAWPRPALGARDLLPFLVADQLLLGGRTSGADPKRSDASPLGAALGAGIGASNLWDRQDGWAAPPMVDTGPGLYTVLFNSSRSLTPEETAAAARAALRRIEAAGLGDGAIETAKAQLASYYETWLLEPNARVIADHMVALAATGRDPAAVLGIPDAIRAVRPAAVRAAFRRHLLNVDPIAVVLPPAPPA